jgi:hypothetical protein
MEVFDRSLTRIPIEMHTKYLSNFHIKYISNSDQFVSCGCAHVCLGPGPLSFRLPLKYYLSINNKVVT